MTSPEGTGDDVTGLLQSWRHGDATAGDALLERVYAELKRIAAAQLRGERAAHTLQPTALVHETYLRLVGQQGVDWRDRAHFFGLAATMMRRVLVDYARARAAAKRGGESHPESITVRAEQGPEVEILDLDRALTTFAKSYPRQTRVVELRYFADLEVADVAECLSISEATVKRDWHFARAWLRAEMGASP